MLAVLGRKRPCARLRVAPVPLRAFHAGRLCPAKTNRTPRGRTQALGPRTSRAVREITIMATKTPSKTATTSARRQPVRQAITFEAVAHIAPTYSKADTMVATYGLEPVDYAAIREATEEHVALIAKTLETNLNEKAMAIFLQRVVGSFVGGAYGAAQFYGTKRSDALALHSKLLNEHRDEDRDGVVGFESKAERAAVFAAEMGLQAYALMAAAEGAVSAYAHITGDEWKPYEAPQPANTTTQRKSIAAMMDALKN